MSADGPGSGWTNDVIGFLERNLLKEMDCEGWDHMFTTAYQIGCEAMVALGQAEETERGAIPRADPRLPNPLPRWDDVSVTVLLLANQNGRVLFGRKDGSAPTLRHGGIPLGFNKMEAIRGAHNLGPAYVDPEVGLVLQSLGLIAGGEWTGVAETVLWRDNPKEWALDFTSDPRFSDAVSSALNTIPHDIQDEMNRLAKITETDVEAAVARSAAVCEELRAQHGPKASIAPPHDNEQARRSLEFGRTHDLDWLFFRRWRLSDGWLKDQHLERALGIFHDRLAIEMRRAVIAKLFPDIAFLTK